MKVVITTTYAVNRFGNGDKQSVAITHDCVGTVHVNKSGSSPAVISWSGYEAIADSNIIQFILPAIILAREYARGLNAGNNLNNCKCECELRSDGSICPISLLAPVMGLTPGK